VDRGDEDAAVIAVVVGRVVDPDRGVVIGVRPGLVGGAPAGDLGQGGAAVGRQVIVEAADDEAVLVGRAHRADEVVPALAVGPLGGRIVGAVDPGDRRRGDVGGGVDAARLVVDRARHQHVDVLGVRRRLQQRDAADVAGGAAGEREVEGQLRPRAAAVERAVDAVVGARGVGGLRHAAGGGAGGVVG